MKTIVSKSENTEYLKYIAGVKRIQLLEVGPSKNFFKIFKGNYYYLWGFEQGLA